MIDGADRSTRDATQTARRFLDALASRDFDALEKFLAPDLWFRALLPRSLHESSTAAEATETYRSWYAPAQAFEPLETEHFRLANRDYLRYRFLLRPPWAPEEWHVIEQAGFCRIQDGRLSRLDIVCTGFHPAGESLSVGSSRSAPI